MKTLDLDAILLSMLLVTMAMVSVVSATGQGFNEQNSVNVSNALNVPDHYIPPEYFMGAKPATPLLESEMITIILSEKTHSILGPDKETGVLALPVSPQDLNARFMKWEAHQSVFIEKSINPSDAVVLVRMPEAMYYLIYFLNMVF